MAEKKKAGGVKVVNSRAPKPGEWTRVKRKDLDGLHGEIARLRNETSATLATAQVLSERVKKLEADATHHVRAKMSLRLTLRHMLAETTPEVTQVTFGGTPHVENNTSPLPPLAQ